MKINREQARDVVIVVLGFVLLVVGGSYFHRDAKYEICPTEYPALSFKPVCYLADSYTITNDGTCIEFEGRTLCRKFEIRPLR